MMKKTILLLLLFTTIFSTSCSSDDDDTLVEDTFMNTTINNSLKESVIISSSVITNNEGATIISLSGTLVPSVDGNFSDFIRLNIKQFEVGTNAVTFDSPVIVKFNEVYYRDSDGTFTVNITRNEANVIEGTYSGEVREESNPDSFVEITNGNFRYIFPN